MATETITIRVDSRAAQAFKAAPEAQRQKLEQLLSFRLLEAAQMSESLEDLMRRISHNAQSRGLTPEMLQDMLSDDE